MCDGKATLSPLAAFQLVEDAVTELLGQLHIDGVTAMREYGATWVFVKTVIRFFQRPSWPEGLEIRSFVSARSFPQAVLKRIPGTDHLLAGEIEAMQQEIIEIVAENDI